MLRRAFVAAAALLFVLIGLILVPFVVPADRFRPLIIRLAERGTGRRVEVETLRLRLLPSVRLQVVNLRIKNPPDFPAGDALVVKSMDVMTTPASLFARRLDVTRVSLDGVQINLVRSAAGKSNYDFSDWFGRPAALPPADGGDRQNAAAFTVDRVHSIHARHVGIAEGTYEPLTGRVVPQFTVDGLDVQVGGIHFDAPNWVDAVTIGVNLRGLGFSSPALLKPIQFRDGRIRIARGGADGTFSVALDTLRVDGVVKIDDLKHPVADFDVSIPELDVDRLKILVTTGKIGPLPVGGPGGPGPLAKGRFTIGRLIVRPFDAHAAAGRITMYKDRAELNAYSLSVFGGTVRGAGAVRYAPRREPAQISAVIRGVDVAAAAKAVGAAMPLGFAGALDADAQITVPSAPAPLAAPQRDPLSSLAADGTFALRDGRVSGLAHPLQISRGTFSVRAGAVRGTFAASLGTLTAQGTVSLTGSKSPPVDFDIAVPDLDLD
ncbi:MAG TPA: AsmA family protein, partial [bacterium]|nr:AsmA family protein [bacterium]